jgi:hypothetical protein
MGTWAPMSSSLYIADPPPVFRHACLIDAARALYTPFFGGWSAKETCLSELFWRVLC